MIKKSLKRNYNKLERRKKKRGPANGCEKRNNFRHDAQ